MLVEFVIGTTVTMPFSSFCVIGYYIHILRKRNGLMLDNLYSPKKEYFDTRNTKSYEFRVKQLAKLKNIIRKY